MTRRYPDNIGNNCAAGGSLEFVAPPDKVEGCLTLQSSVALALVVAQLTFNLDITSDVHEVVTVGVFWALPVKAVFLVCDDVPIVGVDGGAMELERVPCDAEVLAASESV